MRSIHAFGASMDDHTNVSIGAYCSALAAAISSASRMVDDANSSRGRGWTWIRNTVNGTRNRIMPR